MAYYGQAMQGQMSLLSSARPIEQWLADPQVKPELKSRLSRVQDIRAFAVTHLRLPDNGSYKNYADVKRKYAIWNVVATPELSLKPRQWCFPVAGCVDYRGYYNKEAAQVFAEYLRRQGYDVHVSGVPAYSTLGWFNDPVISTFIEYPDPELARLVFHELAHQVVYAPGDSQFNESFATAVEEIGVGLWLDQQADAAMRVSYKIHQQRREDFLKLLTSYKAQLDENFQRPVSDADKRAGKREIFRSLRQDYERMKAERWGGYAGYDPWFSDAISNAHFVLVSTYHELVPAFHALYAEQPEFPSFYRKVRMIAQLNKEARRARLMPSYSAAQQTSTEVQHMDTAAAQ